MNPAELLNTPKPTRPGWLGSVKVERNPGGYRSKFARLRENILPRGSAR